MHRPSFLGYVAFLAFVADARYTRSMPKLVIEQDAASLLVYPTLSGAAEILGVSASTLSRRDDVEGCQMGQRDLRLPASEVMRLAYEYRRRSVNEVALDLIDRAAAVSNEGGKQVEKEIDYYVAGRAPSRISRGEFLREAERSLPPEIYREVERVYDSGDGYSPPD